jgi:hypothetical protein
MSAPNVNLLPLKTLTLPVTLPSAVVAAVDPESRLKVESGFCQLAAALEVSHNPERGV